MTEAELPLALGAGMLAAVNPCGFALLPAYLSLLVLGDNIRRRRAAVRRVLGLTAAMTLGFVAVFGVFGLVISPIASGVQRYLSWVTVVAVVRRSQEVFGCLPAGRFPPLAGVRADPRSAAGWCR